MYRTGQLLGGQHTRSGGQVHLGPLVIAGERGVEFPGRSTEGVDEGLCDPARMGMHERGVADRIGRPVGRQFVDPGLLVAGADSAQYAIDETRTHRVEFNARLLNGGRYGGMCVDAGAQQLIGPQAQQVEQDRIDCLR